ncbi:50S ribosomal protein L19 [Candidatus Berkelbacteria bacterium CG_4_9_14_0_2_um_filter_42_30]|uniref:Large ribosomal subunit protein bL19 n=3 Tax=Candidatus Berkelbacteria TaxID=1618330 RepID=A0A2M8G2T8_9BACT|nr:MAG: 50S ribosomal protein L19 [Candidatus Berkelbacteria bacterium CG_4_10_14_0_8_um_filter_42_34]PJC65953.1 MAG: 50S ribosomal protein L19 [Candidatus Berkelbacteria bacterium CG_4_9_14_0_2_um_filter_42_30]
MQAIFAKHLKKNIPDIHSGDTVRVHQIIKEGDKERIQVFEGLVIATHGGKTLDGTFTVRKESFGVGVERVYPLHSPRVVKIERIKQSRVRRSKLYFIRELAGKEARLKELNRDYKIWEEPEAEKELEKIAEETAKEAEKAKAEKAAEDAGMEAKAAAALAAHQSGGSDNTEEKNQPKADQPLAEAEKAIATHDEVKENKE